MEITARAYSDKARQVILDGIRRTAQGVALSAGVPEDLAPIVTVLDAESTPVMYNDPALTARVRAALVRALGAQNVIDEEPGTASEDFGILGLEGRKIPTMMFGLGAIDPEIRGGCGRGQARAGAAQQPLRARTRTHAAHRGHGNVCGGDRLAAVIQRRIPLTLEAIVEGGLCIGCGLCRAVAGADGAGAHKIEIVLTPEGRERPWRGSPWMRQLF
jgi:hypothetical protein